MADRCHLDLVLPLDRGVAPTRSDPFPLGSLPAGQQRINDLADAETMACRLKLGSWLGARARNDRSSERTVALVDESEASRLCDRCQPRIYPQRSEQTTDMISDGLPRDSKRLGDLRRRAAICK